MRGISAQAHQSAQNSWCALQQSDFTRESRKGKCAPSIDAHQSRKILNSQPKKCAPSAPLKGVKSWCAFSPHPTFLNPLGVGAVVGFPPLQKPRARRRGKFAPEVCIVDRAARMLPKFRSAAAEQSRKPEVHGYTTQTLDLRSLAGAAFQGVGQHSVNRVGDERRNS